MNKDNKIIFVGKLIGQKLGYKFICYKKENYRTTFYFKNKENFERVYSTYNSYIKDYLTFTNSDILKVLFNK